jgi:hypothetical protein
MLLFTFLHNGYTIVKLQVKNSVFWENRASQTECVEAIAFYPREPVFCVALGIPRFERLPFATVFASVFVERLLDVGVVLLLLLIPLKLGELGELGEND